MSCVINGVYVSGKQEELPEVLQPNFSSKGKTPLQSLQV